MSYQFIKEKLDQNNIVILDGGNGGELEQIGAKMDKDLWAGKSAIDDPDKLFQVHENYIKSGADVITSNTYAITPISMKEYGYEEFIKVWHKKTVDIALKAAASTDREIAVAGSVSTSGSWDKLTNDEIKPGFTDQLNILSDAGVDLIILEAMTSKDETVETMIECSSKINLPIWLSISCAMNNEEEKLMHGYQESVTNSKAKFYDYLENSLTKFSQLHKGTVGAYPNDGYFEKPNWKLVDNISPSNYLEEAKSWVANGAQIIGGCCGVGPDKIKAISVLK